MPSAEPIIGSPPVRSLLQCPACKRGGLEPGNDELTCTSCTAAFPVVGGRPVLFRPGNPLFRTEDYLRVTAAPAPNPLARLVPSPSVNLASDQVLASLSRLLADQAYVLVVGAGTQRSWLQPRITRPTRTILYCDADVRATVDLFCDAHDLPFKDGSFDALITTAVLEHVIYPERVASEIARVVRLGGLLYSELPFMQQVHEGAYDFTRYTLSGHRRLFNQFDEIEAGMVAGPGTALVWAIENFVLAFVRGTRVRTLAKAAVRVGTGWIKHFDRLLKDRPEAMDGASCTYLLGRRTGEQRTDQDIVRSYVGAKPLSHT